MVSASSPSNIVSYYHVDDMQSLRREVTMQSQSVEVDASDSIRFFQSIVYQVH